ncbi:hypothetical protein KJ780_04730, partial [Candidatus Micrarchaeota archaeon]|nr:hypothetical protein [Candidatus Micrarchaeota archaeon]
MAHMRVKVQESENSSVVPVNIYKQVKESLLKVIPEAEMCIPKLALEIVKQGKVKEVDEYANSLRMIRDLAESNDVFHPLTENNPAYIFVKYRDKCVDIAKAAKTGTIGVFYVFQNESIADLFVKYTDKFVEIAKSIGKKSGSVFLVFENKLITKSFIAAPAKITNAFVDIAKVSGEDCSFVFYPFVYPAVADLFVKYTDKFVLIAKESGEETYSVFKAFTDELISESFIHNPDKFIATLMKISEMDGLQSACIFRSLKRWQIAKPFKDYIEDKIPFEHFITDIFSDRLYAVEVGWPLDSLFEEREKRLEYLAGLNDAVIIGL